MAENNENEAFNDFYRNYLNENAESDAKSATVSTTTVASAPTSVSPETPSVKSALAANISDTAVGASAVTAPTTGTTQSALASASSSPASVSALAEIAKGNKTFDNAATPSTFGSAASTNTSAPAPVETPVAEPAKPLVSTLSPSSATQSTISAPAISTLQDLAAGAESGNTNDSEQKSALSNPVTPDNASNDVNKTATVSPKTGDDKKLEDLAKPVKPTKEPKVKENKPTPPIFYTVTVVLITILLAFATVFASAKFGLLNGIVGSNVSSDYVTNQANRAYQKDDANPNWEKIFADVNPSVVSIEIVVGQSQELGSGFIYDANGTIITNNHVVADAAADKTGKATISVTLADGRIYGAEIIGRDELTDLAAIKLKNAPEGLTAMEFNNSDDVTVGDRVMAVGNPLGLANTATTGIVSALDRPVSAGDSATSGSVVVSNSIQIDAAINPGNSGGPLFDASAKVIGVNSSIAQTSSNSGSIGLGFAIPSNTAKLIVDAIIKDGSVKHAALGVSAQSAQVQFDGSDHRATKIVEVGKDSPAEKAGVQKDDYIVGMNGKPVISNLSLIGFINALPLNTEIKLSIIRDGKQQEITVKLDKERDSALSGLSSSSDQKATPSAPDSDSFDPFEELER